MTPAARSSPVLQAALAGYIQPPDGGWIAFARFMDMPIPSPTTAMTVANAVEEAMGEISRAVFESQQDGVHEEMQR